MPKIEYTKTDTGFLVTDFTNDEKNSLDIRFDGAISGTLRINAKSFRIEDSLVRIEHLSLDEGIHTPMVESNGSPLACDPIKVEAGTVSLPIESLDRILYLTKRSIEADRLLKTVNEKISELSSAVYGKSIL